MSVRRSLPRQRRAAYVTRQTLPYEPIVEETITIWYAVDGNNAKIPPMSWTHRRRLRRWRRDERRSARKVRRLATDALELAITHSVRIQRDRTCAIRSRQACRSRATRTPRQRARSCRTRRAATDSASGADNSGNGDGRPARRLRRRPRGPPRRGYVRLRRKHQTPELDLRGWLGVPIYNSRPSACAGGPSVSKQTVSPATGRDNFNHFSAAKVRERSRHCATHTEHATILLGRESLVDLTLKLSRGFLLRHDSLSSLARR